MGAGAALVERMIRIIKQAETEAPPKAAQRMVGEGVTLVSDAMGEWYASYGPTYYTRTYGLFGGILAGSHESAGGNVYTLTVDSSAVPTGSNPVDDGDYRFNGAFVMGLHGTSQIAFSTPPPKIYEPRLEDLGDKKIDEAVDEYIMTI